MQKVLRECKRYLSYAGLGTEQFVNIGRMWIPRTLIRAIVMFALLGMAILMVIKTINDYNISLNATLLPIHCLVHNITKFAVYSVLIRKIDQIVRLFDYVEMVVRRRMFNAKSSVHRVRTKRNQRIYLFFFFFVFYEQEAVYPVHRTPFTSHVSRTKNELCWLLVQS